MDQGDIERAERDLATERARLEQEKLSFEMDRAKAREGFFNKNFGSIVGGAISLVAVSISVSQLFIAQSEMRLKEAEVKNKAAEFVMSNSKVIISGDIREQSLLQKIMERTFSADICQPVFAAIADRAKSVQEIALWSPPKSVSAAHDSMPVTRRVFLHYKASKDSSILDSITEALVVNGFDVQGKQRVTQPTAGDVRYFSNEDKTVAADIKKIVEETLRKKNIPLALKTIYLGENFRNMPRGVYEVWIPQL